MRGAGLQRNLLRAFESFDLYGTAEDGLGDGDLLLAVNVVAVASKPLVRI